MTGLPACRRARIEETDPRSCRKTPEDAARRGIRTAFLAVIAILSGSAPGPADEVPPLFGAIPGRVAARISVQVFEDEPDQEIDHGAIAAVEVTSETSLTIELGSGTRYVLPVAAGHGSTLAERVRSSTGELLSLEYQPKEPTEPRHIHAAWTLSPLPQLAGEGLVPLDRPLYRTVLRLAPDELPRTGVFAPIVRARDRLDALLEHVSNENGRQTDELVDAFLAAVRESGLHLGYFKTHGGEPVTDEFLQSLRERGVVRSVQQYWAAAIRRYHQGRPVNPVLDLFEAEWRRCPPDAEIEVPFPKGSVVMVNESVLLDLRRLGAQNLLDRTVLAAEARDVERTETGIDAFRRELENANATADRFTLADFEIRGEAVTEERLDDLLREAKGETGFWGFFRVLWRRAFGGEAGADVA